jgi:hypothetical protein
MNLRYALLHRVHPYLGFNTPDDKVTD